MITNPYINFSEISKKRSYPSPNKSENGLSLKKNGVVTVKLSNGKTITGLFKGHWGEDDDRGIFIDDYAISDNDIISIKNNIDDYYYDELDEANEPVEFTLPNVNSLGEPIAVNEESLRNFWNWFGDSKVVDKQGRPLVVYHGSSKTFEKFYQYVAEGWGEGCYFTDNLDDASEYGEKIYKVYLKISNPYTGDIDQIMNTPTVKHYDDFDIVNESGYLMGKAIREAGFDGIIVKDSNNINGLEIVAFNSNQIKSITNKGSWSKESNNINESEEISNFDNQINEVLRLAGVKND